MTERTRLLTESIQKAGIILQEADLKRIENLASAIFESGDGPDTEVIENGPEGEPGDTFEELRDKSISSGTMLATELFPKFVEVLKKYNPEEASQYDGIDIGTMDDETVADTMDNLFDSMDTIAPSGCYFGTSEGDGADFGFWTSDDFK